MLPWVLWSGHDTKKYHWYALILDLRYGRSNFKGNTSGGDGDGLVLLTRKIVGPFALSYQRAPRR